MTTSSTHVVSVQRQPELIGQTVVIVGGSSGIGLETARRAHDSEGANIIIIAARDPDRLRVAAQDIGAVQSAAFDANDAAALQRFMLELPKPIDFSIMRLYRASTPASAPSPWVRPIRCGSPCSPPCSCMEVGSTSWATGSTCGFSAIMSSALWGTRPTWPSTCCAGSARTPWRSQLPVNSDVPGLGASGAIAGVLGGYLVLYPTSRIGTLIGLGCLYFPARIYAWAFIVFWFLLQLVNGVASLGTDAAAGGGVAYWAHVGGFLTGVVLVRLFAQPARAGQLSGLQAQSA